MLEVQTRDGAGRVGRITVEGRSVEFPAILWHAARLPPGPLDWQPQIASDADPNAFLVASSRFTDVQPSTASGQLFLERRLAPTATMIEGGVRLQTLGDAVAVWDTAYDLSKDAKPFALALAKARSNAGFAKALYAQGLGEPQALALLVYAGIDVFDATPLHLAAARGEYLTVDGRYDAATLREAPCACPVCGLEAPQSLTQDELAAHNQYAARAELGQVRAALAAGRLRELVEARVRAHPELTALLRRLDAQHGFFEQRMPIQRATTLFANTKESLQRAECRRFRTRVHERYRPPTSPPVLLLLPCSHRKPYSTSRTHRAFGDTIWSAGAAGLVHDVILTSPLGLVPRELELTYPAAHYDVPVTGEWDDEEGAMIRSLLSGLFAKRSYARVVSHLPKHTHELVRGLLPADTIVTCEGENATESNALRRLELVLRQLTGEHARANLRKLHLERLRAISDYQFGPAATDKLFAGADAGGKWPTGKLFADGEQLAMLPTTRGLLSLTLAGAARLLEAKAYTVEIEDFRVKGGVFAVGVRDADRQIRPGDEVVVHHKGDLRAVGTALMSGPEMVELKRGEAVNARHHT